MRIILVPLSDHRPRRIDSEQATTEVHNLCLKIAASGETDVPFTTLMRQIIDLYDAKAGQGILEGSLSAYGVTLLLFRNSRQNELIAAEAFARGWKELPGKEVTA